MISPCQCHYSRPRAPQVSSAACPSLQGHQLPSLSTESSSGQVHAGHAAALMAAGLNGNVAAPLPLEAEERPAKRPRTGNRMVRPVLCDVKMMSDITTRSAVVVLLDMTRDCIGIQSVRIPS